MTMKTTTLQLYALEYNRLKTYGVAALFVLGNVVLPQLCHLVHLGGPTILPIYFFTLVGAYKYGWRVGLLTAVVSPLVNSALFGMPAVESLSAILLKSVLLAAFAGYTAARYRRASLLLLAGVVLAYQVLGTLGEWMMGDTFYEAAQDFRIGMPGMLLQVFGGWVMINKVIRR